MIFDVVVVGGGPAGSTSALGLARGGWRVLLLDRAHFPRAKPCGDCLSPEATRVLDRLGLLHAVEGAAPARLTGWTIYAPDGGAFTGAFHRAAGGDPRAETSIAIERERLDALLLDAAREAGAEVRTGVRVQDFDRDASGFGTVRCRDADGRAATFHARLVVAADGLRSIVARRAGATAPPGRLRKLSFTLHTELPAAFTAGRGEMHVVAGGCIGIAPVGVGANPRHNVTVVVDQRWRRIAARDPLALVARMLEAAPGLGSRRNELARSLGRAGPIVASGPFDRPTRFVVADALALVGDAAGYYDPFTGQGVCHALLQAEDLAEHASRALRTPGPVAGRALAPYARRLRSRGRAAKRIQRGVEAVVSRPRLMNVAARTLRDAPRFADALVATTGDIAPARSLFGMPALDLAGALMRRGGLLDHDR